jgi:CDP-glucose 4,6-dehydratase
VGAQRRALEGVGLTRAFWKGKRVLVTGSTGFKGSWLSYWLSRMGADVSGFSLAPNTEPSLFASARLSEPFETRIADIRDERSVIETIRSIRPEVIFHLAAQSLVRFSYEQPLQTYAINAMGTAHLLEGARLCDAVRVVVCVTTDKCYDNREWVWPYREVDALGGRDPYASSKACAELIAAAYRSSFFLQSNRPSIATARGGNVIGGGDWAPHRLVPDLVRAFENGTSAIVRNPESVRPWQFVLDALHGYMSLARRMWEDPGNYCEAWNFGPDSWSDRCVALVANALKDAWGRNARWHHQPPSDAPHEASLLKLDSSKARARLGWCDLVPFDDALQRVARWYVGYYGGSDARALMDADIDDFERRMESAL